MSDMEGTVKSHVSFKKCHVIDCGHRKSSHNCSLSKFPTDPVRCQEWIKVVGNEDLLGLPLKKLSTIRYICSCHFKNDDYKMTKTGKRLNKNAVPSIFSNNVKSLSDYQMEDFAFKSLVIPSKQIRVPVKDISNTSEYSFHNMFSNMNQRDSINLSTSHKMEGVGNSSVEELQLPELHGEMLHVDEKTRQLAKSVEVATVTLTESLLTKRSVSSATAICNDENSSMSKPTAKRQRCYDSSVAVDRLSKKQVMEKAGLRGVPLSPNKIKLISYFQKTLAAERRQVRASHHKNIQQQNLLDQLMLDKQTNGVSEIGKSVKSLGLQQMVQIEGTNCYRKPQGHRFTIEQKILGVSLAKRGPNCYRHLHNLIPTLPSVRTVKRTLEQIPLKPGINENVLNAISSTHNSRPLDKYVILALDETKLKKRLIFIEGSTSVSGFACDASGVRSPNLAGSVLLGMILGLNINKPFTQPIYYNYSQSGFSSDAMRIIILHIIKKLTQAGLIVVGVNTDQGSANRAALNSLMNQTEGGKEGAYFKIPDIMNKIFVLCDISHLMKTSRNCFQGDWIKWYNSQKGEAKNKWLYEGNTIQVGNKKAYWSDIRNSLLYAQNNNKPTRLTEEHIFPSSKNKMKTKYAAQVQSKSVAEILKDMATMYPEKYPTAYETAEVIEFLDESFDYMNGSNIKHNDIKASTSRRNVTPKSGHFEKWKELEDKWKTVQYQKINSNTKNSIIRTPTPKAIISNFIALAGIANFLFREAKFDKFNIRNTTEDPVENVFGSVRQLQGDNNNLCCVHFESALKTLLVTRFSDLNIEHSNCENHMTHNLVDLNNLLASKQGNCEETKISETNNIKIVKDSVDIESDHNDSNDDIITIHIEDNEESFSEFCEIGNAMTPISSVEKSLLKHFYRHKECHACNIFLYSCNPEGTIDKTGSSSKLKTFIASAITEFSSIIIPKFHEADIFTFTLELFSLFFEDSWLECANHSKSLKKSIINKLSTILFQAECTKRNKEAKASEQRSASLQKLAELKGEAK